MTDIQRHAAGMQAALPEILTMAERCVNIDSGSYMAGGVNAVIDIWAGMAAGMGFAVERTPLPGFGDQMTARLPLGGNGPRVLVLGHAFFLAIEFLILRHVNRADAHLLRVHLGDVGHQAHARHVGEGHHTHHIGQAGLHGLVAGVTSARPAVCFQATLNERQSWGAARASRQKSKPSVPPDDHGAGGRHAQPAGNKAQAGV
eukprot:gene14924-18231_t